MNKQLQRRRAREGQAASPRTLDSGKNKQKVEAMEEHKNDDICRKEMSESSATSALEETNFKDQFTEVNNSSARNGFTRLSSKCKCSSLPGCDGSKFDSEITSLHNQFSTQLSSYTSNNMHVSKEEVASAAGPDNEVPSIILNWPLKCVKEDATEEEVMKWRLEMNDCPFMLSESGDSSYDCSLSERSSVVSSPCTSFTVHSDTQSEDLDITDIWVASFDLDEVDSALVHDSEQCSDIFNSDFPSPSFSTMRSQQTSSTSSSPATSHTKEANNSDEPIFWPLERSSYNSPEFEKFMILSPRRNTVNTGLAGLGQLNPIMLRLHQNNLSAAKKDIEACKGKVNLGAKGTRVSIDKVQKTAAVPSRLSRTTKLASQHRPSNNCLRRPPHLKIGAQRNDHSLMLADRSLQELEASDLQNLASRKIPIEEFIGLDEFDGHEGISPDAWRCDFSLCVSPR